MSCRDLLYDSAVLSVRSPSSSLQHSLGTDEENNLARLCQQKLADVAVQLSTCHACVTVSAAW